MHILYLYICKFAEKITFVKLANIYVGRFENKGKETYGESP